MIQPPITLTPVRSLQGVGGVVQQLAGLDGAGLVPRTLNDGEVHVWRAGLDCGAPVVRRLYQTLSPDERARAGRFHHERDRTRFIAARGLLRRILGHYLGVTPAQLAFTYAPHGKPALATPLAHRGLMFNVSHAHDMALYALTRGRNIGIDIEQIRTDIPYERLAARFFSAPEVSSLHALPHAQRLRGFYCCWTRKEAYLKARGDGLALPLDQFSVSLAEGEPAALLHVQWDPAEVSRWSLHDLGAGAGYVAALAVEGRPVLIREWAAEAALDLF